MKLLEDVFIIEQLQVINEGKAGTGPMKVRGIFQRADEANNNKRIYRRPLLEREVTKLATAMNERRLMGELDHPQHDSVKLSNVSHLITGLNMKGNEVIGEAEILNTPAGKVAQALIEGGVKIGISSRGMGTVTEELDGNRYVNEDFKLITWDIVADPSTRGAFPGLTESTQIQEIIDTVYPEAQKVKNFTTLLKEELKPRVRSDKPKPKFKVGSRPWTPASTWEADKKKRLGISEAAPKKHDAEWYKASDVEARGNQDRPGIKTPWLKRHYGPGGGKGSSTDLVPKKGATPVSRTSKKHTPQNSSTQFVNFMRDRLEEKTRLQKETEKRSKPTRRGRVATFRTSGGKTVKVQDYKASRGGGEGSQAHALAVDLEQLPSGHPKWKQHAKRVTSGKGRKGKLARGAQNVRNVRMDRDSWRGAQNMHGRVRALSLKNKPHTDSLARSRRDSKEGGAVSRQSERHGSMNRRDTIRKTGPGSRRSPGTLPK